MTATTSARCELRCTRCARTLPDGATEGTCSCGGILAVEWDLERCAHTLSADALASRPATMLRYRELLPLLDVDPAMPAVVTPLQPAPRLAQALGVASVAVKVETMQPTGSLKDRASAIGVARAQGLGHTDIACASSGNAATAMAGMAAAQGLRATVFVPRRTPAQKLLQLAAYGARVLLVDGSYEAAYELCQQAAPRFGWYNRNSGQNPYLVEGKKTCGLEIGEQAGMRPPDWVAVAVGDGCTITGIWKGLRELHELGLAPGVPRMLGVQASTAATVLDAWRETADIEAVEGRYPAPDTIADSISVSHPQNGARAVAAVRDSGGAVVAVDDEQIATATLELGKFSGLFAEPAAAAAAAGVRAGRETGTIGPHDRVVVVATGSGFKNLTVVERAVPAPVPVAPSLDAVEARIAAGP